MVGHTYMVQIGGKDVVLLTPSQSGRKHVDPSSLGVKTHPKIDKKSS